jgi:hypothetical protein
LGGLAWLDVLDGYVMDIGALAEGVAQEFRAVVSAHDLR